MQNARQAPRSHGDGQAGRRLSGITPSGHAQLGNYLGAIRRWAAEGDERDLYFIADLHAMTTTHNPAKLRALAGEALAVLVASGIPPERVFVQSDLSRELGALTWILECTCSYGEAARMILDEPDLIRRKVRRAVTDTFSTPAYRPDERPGVANLLEILAACSNRTPADVAGEHSTYGALKEAVAEAVIEMLRPVRERTAELLADPAELARLRKASGARAAERGEHRLSSALRLIGGG